ncbi:phage protease [Aliarcobacter vitoriensis]|uniref:Mu-like prophage I protein n=1 Tax=Aliarcobacter vitoriensis TaxID=2011099 RepID=A0A366MQ61_9BACT|nr:phage protease [Aliarcobacter vitoriensis]RBQ28406.1 hypothetical protein CRU91_09300 [Aliarcobacter vitoriensis]
MNEHLRRLLELNYKAKEKVLISPVGSVVGLDGRTFNIDGAIVIENTKSNGIDLVFEVDHGFGEHGGKAAGWFKVDTLELRADGIYASLDTTPLGDELIDKKLYRYVSPAFVMDRNKDDRSVLALDSVGLVNRPNLIKDALNSKDQILIKDLNSKVENLELEKNEAMKTVEATSKELSETTDKLTEANSKVEKVEKSYETALEANKNLKIDLAVEQNKILPKDREFCKSLNDEQLDSYIQNNAGSILAKELGKNIDLKENNSSKNLIDKAIAAGSKK